MLNPLSFITQKFYHNSNHFVTSLKNVSFSLNFDLRDFLTNHHAVNLSLVKAPLPDMVNPKLVSKFLELLLSNLDSCVVLNLKKWTEVKALLYFVKMVLKTYVCKCGLLDSRRDSLIETGTEAVVPGSPSPKSEPPPIPQHQDLDCVDSGIELEGSTTSGSGSKIHGVSTGSIYPSQSRRKWSVVSEEGSDLGGESSQDESDCGGAGRVSFHLGDADTDQSEAKLALGEVDLSRLKRRDGDNNNSEVEAEDSGKERIPAGPPRRVKISLSDSKLKDSCSPKYTPCYYCNGTYITDHSRFNPYYFCQVLAKPGQQVSYDMEYVSFVKIIELFGSGQIRHFNLNEEPQQQQAPANAASSLSLNLSGSTEEEGESQSLGKKVKDFVDGYVQLAKVTNDNGKLDNYTMFQLEQIRGCI